MGEVISSLGQAQAQPQALGQLAPPTEPKLSQILQARDDSRNVAPFQAALAAAQQKYPRLKSIPMALTTGVGPGASETYEPEDDENPIPSKWTVQLRDPKVLNNPSLWPSYIGLEALHPLQASDPTYQGFTQKFIDSMTPDQMKDARHAYERDKKVFNVKQSFEDWLPHVQAQEYIRGMMFPDAIPNWTGPKGEGKYTKEQLQLGDQIKKYLQTPPQ